MNVIFLAQANFGGGNAPSASGAAPAGAGGAATEAVAGGAGTAAQGAGGGGFEQLFFIGVMIVVFYFLLIRPQKKRADKHKEMVTQLSAGDQVITNSGIFGDWCVASIAKVGHAIASHVTTTAYTFLRGCCCTGRCLCANSGGSGG